MVAPDPRASRVSVRPGAGLGVASDDSEAGSAATAFEHRRADAAQAGIGAAPCDSGCRRDGARL
jgi:hypothetical protein